MLTADVRLQCKELACVAFALERTFVDLSLAPFPSTDA
jgi:hypothetical protein